MKEYIVGISLSLCLLQGLHAQDSLEAQQLDEVVVTGQYVPESMANSVYQVRVISQEAIRARGATKLEDVLNTQLNMQFSQDGATGSARLAMQGMSGQNIKILLDGVPIIGRQGVANEIDINQINVHTVERIEIVEGPMSTMYGADALAGVINIITKKSSPQTWSLTAGLLEKTAGTEYGLQQGIHNQNLGGTYALKKWNFAADVAKNYFGGWQGQATGREKEWLPKDQIMASARIGFTPSSGEIHYRIGYLYETIDNPGPLQFDQALDQDYTTHRFMHQLQANFSLSDRLRFSGIASYTDYRRKKRTIVVDAMTNEKTLSLGEGAQAETKIDGVTARGTFVHNTTKTLSLQAGFDINLLYGTGERVQRNEGIGDYALFGSIEWAPTQNIRIRPGFRATYNSAYQAPPVIPSLNLKWSFASHTIRASYGYGFRAPSLRELYFNFFDTNHSIEGNTDLRAEHSHSVNGTWHWQPVDDLTQLGVTVGGFYNNVRNKIAYGQRVGTTVTTYINIDEYETYGVNVRGTLNLKRVEASIGFSYSHALFWSPEVTSRLAYKIPKASLLFSFYYKYNGPSLIYSIGDDTSNGQPARNAAFHIADLTVQKVFFKRLILNAGVQNLFDVTRIGSSITATGVHGGGTTTPMSYGRSYFLGISYVLDHALTGSNRVKKS